MRLVHQNHQVLKVGEIVEIGLPKILRQAFHFWRALLALLAVGVELRDVEHIDLYLVFGKQRMGLVVVVARNHYGLVVDKLRNAPEHILFIGWVTKIANQFLVKRQIRSQDKEMSNAFLQIQIGNASPHQPRLTNARGNRKGKRRKITLEILALQADFLYLLHFCFKESRLFFNIWFLQRQLVRQFHDHIKSLA